MVKYYLNESGLHYQQNNQKSIVRYLGNLLKRNLSREEVKALTNLIKNKDFVIQKADKSNDFVILNRSDCFKTNKFLEDTSRLNRVNIE